MKNLLTLIFFTICIFTQQQTLGQGDTNAINNFLSKQGPKEKKFIELIRSNKIESCLRFFSSSVITKYGKDSLQKELKRLNKLFSKYPNPVITPSLGQSLRDVGSFGHDNIGKYEKKSLYQFMKKEDVVYYFDLYYNDTEPIGIIKNYDSQELTDFKLLRSIKTTQTKSRH